MLMIIDHDFSDDAHHKHHHDVASTHFVFCLFLSGSFSTAVCSKIGSGQWENDGDGDEGGGCDGDSGEMMVMVMMMKMMVVTVGK